jgi:hypothetical protein
MAAGSLETLVNMYQTTRGHTPEERLHTHPGENLKSYMLLCVFNDKINEHAMGGACSMHGEVRNTCKISVGSLKANVHFKSLGVSGTIRELWLDEKRGIAS